jgi:hypothetical protein
MKEFKCRASKIGDLLTGFKKITPAQLERISELINERENLINKNGNKVKWTDAKDVELHALEHLSSNPQLGETAKSYLKEWLISQITGKEKRIESKYFEHGIFAENAAIERAEKYFNTTFPNRQMSFEDDYFTGRFDAANDNLIIDVKCPFDEFTFPYFDNVIDNGYFGQLQIYMQLSGINNACLVYCLEDHSEDEIDRLAQRLAYKVGLEDPTMEHWKEAKRYLTYDYLPEELRIKAYNFTKDDAYIEQAKEAVLMAREYITAALLPQLSNIKFDTL